ncbi:MAG: succinate dehydrogenase, hydrophobic membrane anchor protein [uncultured bacterium]|nr:MAG: succinate dehydrogenase, hydrophobic membrane anchor protein [uncultured bacterium]
MVKSVLGVNHQGLRDWIIQRVSAIFMAVYLLLLIAYLFINPGLSFAEWHGLFSQTWMKIATILFLLAIVFHAWIGMWTIFTDYVKNFVIRSILHSLVILCLTACFIWGVMILWSV